MEIIPDPIHVLLLTLPFLVAVAGGHLILWKPLMEYLEGREHTIHKAQAEAAELHHAAADQLTTLEQRLAAARQKVAEVYAEGRGRALAREAGIVAAARAKADEHVAAAIRDIEASRRVASEALTSSANDLSRDIAGRVLGRDVA